MKLCFHNAYDLARSGRMALLLAAFTLVASAAVGQLQPKSPVGPTWDCVLGGARNGVAYITFFDDGTFSGYEVLVPRAPAAPKPSLVSVIPGSNGLGQQPGASSATNRTELFGACPVSGRWGFDSKGRIMGSFLEVAYSKAATTAEGTSAFTNTVNFLGTVVPGKRLTLLGKSSLGGANYRGVPALALPDIGGLWRGVKQQNRVAAYEFFQLTNTVYTPNSYVVSGEGAGYTYQGLALLSSQKKFALACDILVGTNYQSTRAAFGAYNARKASCCASGLEASSGTLVSTNRVRFQFSKRSSSP